LWDQGPSLALNRVSCATWWCDVALQPRRSDELADSRPPPLPYLDSVANRESGAIDIQLDLQIQTKAMRKHGLAPQRLSSTGYRHAYWTAAQLLCRHTIHGCNLQPGDLDRQVGCPCSRRGDSCRKLNRRQKQLAFEQIPGPVPDGFSRSVCTYRSSTPYREPCISCHENGSPIASGNHVFCDLASTSLRRSSTSLFHERAADAEQTWGAFHLARSNKPGSRQLHYDAVAIT
jgi:hypothetical protein